MKSWWYSSLMWIRLPAQYAHRRRPLCAKIRAAAVLIRARYGTDKAGVRQRIRGTIPRVQPETSLAATVISKFRHGGIHVVISLTVPPTDVVGMRSRCCP
jgi:hypothetical protein